MLASRRHTGPPFVRWTRGTVTEIDPKHASFAVSEVATGKSLVVQWTSGTRWWVEPHARRDKGVRFDPNELRAGADVRVMFKAHAKQNTADRIIRVAAGSAATGKERGLDR